MSILALLTVDKVNWVADANHVNLHLGGALMDGSNYFGDGPIVILGIDIRSLRLKQDIEDAAKSVLSASPYNVTFGSGDIVRVI